MVGEGWLRGRAIGRGSTATVFLATSCATGDVFAVKSSELSRSAPLQREQSILSALCSPAIISCIGFDVARRDGGALFYNLFLEYAAGGSLADQIKLHGRFEETEVRCKTRDVLAGLSYLHGRGVVHCDVKPGNVLLLPGGRAKIGDLGCARWLSDGEREVRGTPMYMAPEAARGEEQGMPADVWSLGCSVVEMLTGRPPWSEIVDVLASIRRIGFSNDVPDIPSWVTEDARDFLGKCLRRDPVERWTVENLLCHPFVAGSACGELSWTSPKSTLDFSLWASMEEDEVEEDEETGKEGFCSEEPAERIQELAVFSGHPNWAWDEEWLEARRADTGASGGTSCSGERVVGGRWNAHDSSSSTGGEDLVGGSKVGSVACEFGHLEEEASGCEMAGCESLGRKGDKLHQIRQWRPLSRALSLLSSARISFSNLLLFFSALFQLLSLGFYCTASMPCN